jgi:hypothetical protein
MTALGVFRDDYYNAVSVLPQTQYNGTTLASGSVLPASLIGGAGDCYITASGGAAVGYTTDSAINIIAAIQIAVANAYKQGLGAFAAGVNPPPGVPNLFNVSWTLTINNQNSGLLTLTAGAGVTITGSATTATVTARVYSVTITSPTTVTFQSLEAYLAGP